MNFFVSADHKLKLKESKNKDKYFDLARTLKKTVEYESYVYTNCNWCALYTQGKINRKTGRFGNKRTVKTIQLQYYWDRPEYWEESWRLEETCYHSNSRERLSANTDVKNSWGVNNKSK